VLQEGELPLGVTGTSLRRGSGGLPLDAPRVHVQIFSTYLSFFTGTVPAVWAMVQLDNKQRSSLQIRWTASWLL